MDTRRCKAKGAALVGAPGERGSPNGAAKGAQPATNAWLTNLRFRIGSRLSAAGGPALLADLARRVPFEIFEDSIPTTDPCPVNAPFQPNDAQDDAVRQCYVVDVAVRSGHVCLLMERHGAAAHARDAHQEADNGSEGGRAPAVEVIGPHDVDLANFFYVDARRRASCVLDLVSGNYVHATRLPIVYEDTTDR
tara:strand:- start:5802 stop:6380 length:579 start_codon:yes stop_codon:yes gene_type:complete